MASKRLGALPRIRRGALGRGYGKEGSGALPLARAAAVSTGLSVRVLLRALLRTHLVRDRVRVRVMAREGYGYGYGYG